MSARHRSLRISDRRAGLLIEKLRPTLVECSGQRLRPGTCWGGVFETSAGDKRQDRGHIASWGPG
jgi:hypothetical protein